MEFFILKTLDQVHHSDWPRIFPRDVCQLPNQDYFAIYFCLKLQKNERTWTPRGANPRCPPTLDVPKLLIIQVFVQKKDAVACDELRELTSTYQQLVIHRWHCFYLLHLSCNLLRFHTRSEVLHLVSENLPATWVIFFKWLISLLLVIGKIHYNAGYWLMAILGKWPTHKQWNFLVSRNISFGAQYWVSETQGKWLSKRNNSYSGHSKIIMCSDVEGRSVSVSTLSYLQLVRIDLFLYCTSTNVISLPRLVRKNRNKCQCNKLV